MFWREGKGGGVKEKFQIENEVCHFLFVGIIIAIIYSIRIRLQWIRAY